MITSDISLERGMSLDNRPGAGNLSSDSASAEEFSSLLQQMTSTEQQDAEQQRAEISALVATTSACPVLEVLAGATRLSEAGVRSLVHITWAAVMAGEETAQVQVRPREMGTLLLNIKVVDDGVYIDARADDPRVLSLLRGSILELAEGLAGRGLTLRGFSTGLREDRVAADMDGEAAPADEPARGEPERPDIHAQRRSFIEVVI